MFEYYDPIETEGKIEKESEQDFTKEILFNALNENHSNVLKELFEIPVLEAIQQIPVISKIPQAVIEKLEKAFKGKVLVRKEDESDNFKYNVRRKLFYNNFREMRPAAILVCESHVDVQKFFSLWKELKKDYPKIKFTPRSGGHSTAGFSSIEDGIMLDLRELKSIVVDTKNNLVHVGAGAKFANLYPILESYDLFTPAGICTQVHVGGYMQGGGYGFGSRMMGMNCDNVVEFQMVLADGRLVYANEKLNADLFWAVRGGTGNNFGILTQVTYRAKAGLKFGAISMKWKLDSDQEAKAGAAAIDFIQKNLMGTNSDTNYGFMNFIHFEKEKDEDGVATKESRNIPYLSLVAIYNREKWDGEKLFADLIQKHPPLKKESKESNYSDLNDWLMGSGKYQKTSFRDKMDAKEFPSQEKQSRFFIEQLGEDKWLEVINLMRKLGTEFTFGPELNIEPGGGAINHTQEGENAYIHRNDHFNAFLNVYWETHLGDLETRRQQAMDALKKWLDLSAPFTNDQAYQNYPKPYLKKWSDKYWKDYYAVLCLAKDKFDSGEFFKFAQSIGNDENNPRLNPEEARKVMQRLIDAKKLPQAIKDWLGKEIDPRRPA